MPSGKRSRIPIPARISSGSAIEVDFIKLISSSCLPCQPGRKILTGSCEKACQGPRCEGQVKIPLPIVRLSILSFFFEAECGGVVGGCFEGKGESIFQLSEVPFFAPMCAHTLIFLIEETPYFRRVCSLSVCTSTDSSQNRFSRVRGG